MSVALQRAQVKTVVEAVSGVGVVHDYQRNDNDPTVADDWYVREGKVNGWFIQTNPLDPDVFTTSEIQHNTEFILTGYLEVNDELKSRKTAEDLTQTLVTAIISARTLSGTATHTHTVKPMPLEHIQIAVGQGSVLCHRVVIRWVTEERADVTYA
jgi:hypothetical protein